MVAFFFGEMVAYFVEKELLAVRWGFFERILRTGEFRRGIRLFCDGVHCYGDNSS